MHLFKVSLTEKVETFVESFVVVDDDDAVYTVVESVAVVAGLVAVSKLPIVVDLGLAKENLRLRMEPGKSRAKLCSAIQNKFHRHQPHRSQRLHQLKPQA